jgi:hypothetical protein
MEKLASLVVRFSQIQAEFGEDVVLRAIHAASVAAAQIVLAEAEAEARARFPVFTAEVIAFPLLKRTDRPKQDQELPCSDD